MTLSHPDRTPAPAAWRPALVALALLWLSVLLIYRDTAAAMVGIWFRSETFAHAFVVPPLSLWLVWRMRSDLRNLSPRPVPWMAAVLAALALVWWLADLVAVNALTQWMLVSMLVACVPAATGWQVTRMMAFPLAFLFFCVPVGEFLTPVLMRYTADFTVLALRLSGLPVYREGLQFVIPTGRWSVVEACSGIRYLMASFMVGTLFAYLNYRSLRRRLAFMAVAIVTPIVANWLRAYLIVMIGHLSDNRLATGVDHLVYGWVFFGIVVVTMFMIGARWAEPDRPAQSSAGAAALAPHLGAGAWWVTAGFALMALALPLALQWHVRTEAAAGEPDLAVPDLTSAGWTPSAEDPGLGWDPVYVAPRAQARQVFERDGRRVGLHLAFYVRQGADSKVVTSVNQIVASNNTAWNQVRSEMLTRQAPAALGGLQMAELWSNIEATESQPRRKLLIWRYYWVNGHFTGNDVQAKLLLAWQRIQGHGDAAAGVIVYTDASAGQPDALLARFIDANSATLGRHLRDVSAR